MPAGPPEAPANRPGPRRPRRLEAPTVPFPPPALGVSLGASAFVPFGTENRHLKLRHPVAGTVQPRSSDRIRVADVPRAPGPALYVQTRC